jgi:hypothetical protein
MNETATHMDTEDEVGDVYLFRYWHIEDEHEDQRPETEDAENVCIELRDMCTGNFAADLPNWRVEYLEGGEVVDGETFVNRHPQYS